MLFYWKPSRSRVRISEENHSLLSVILGLRHGQSRMDMLDEGVHGTLASRGSMVRKASCAYSDRRLPGQNVTLPPNSSRPRPYRLLVAGGMGSVRGLRELRRVGRHLVL